MKPWSEIIPLLQEALDPARVKTRLQGGQTIPYLEGHDAITTANRIFGEDGWNAYPLGAPQRFEIGSRTQVRENREYIVTMFVYTVTFMTEFHGLDENGNIHTIKRGDIGKNTTYSDAPSDHEMAVSGCATDALKRSMRSLGRQFGNTLYDTDHEDHKVAVGKKRPGPKKPKASAKPPRPKKKASTGKKPQKGSGDSALDRALSYTVPEEVRVDGKPVRIPNPGKSLAEVSKDPLGEVLLVWLAGLRDSPAGTPPFVAESEDDIKLQKAVSYVLLNVKKLRGVLTEDEVEVLEERLN